MKAVFVEDWNGPQEFNCSLYWCVACLSKELSEEGPLCWQLPWLCVWGSFHWAYCWFWLCSTTQRLADMTGTQTELCWLKWKHPEPLGPDGKLHRTPAWSSFRALLLDRKLLAFLISSELLSWWWLVQTDCVYFLSLRDAEREKYFKTTLLLVNKDGSLQISTIYTRLHKFMRAITAVWLLTVVQTSIFQNESVTQWP